MLRQHARGCFVRTERAAPAILGHSRQRNRPPQPGTLFDEKQKVDYPDDNRDPSERCFAIMPQDPLQIRGSGPNRYDLVTSARSRSASPTLYAAALSVKRMVYGSRPVAMAAMAAPEGRSPSPTQKNTRASRKGGTRPRKSYVCVPFSGRKRLGPVHQDLSKLYSSTINRQLVSN